MTKDIGELTESEIDKIFRFLGVERQRTSVNYQVYERNEGYVKLNAGFDCKMTINSRGISHSNPILQEKICENISSVERYLVNKGYNFKQKD